MIWSRLALSFLLVAAIGCGAETELPAPDAGSPPGTADASRELDGGTPPERDGGSEPERDGGSEPDASEAPDAGGSIPPEACPEVTEGLNVIQLGGRERRFWVNSPEAGHGPIAAVFWFHGFSGPTSPHDDALSNSAMLDDLGIRPDADPAFPFVRVLLEDTNLQPFQGLDWDIRTDAPNVDLPLFDTVVECVIAHRGVSRDRIFAGGFSAGATIANLIHSARSDVVRAVYTASGLWVNEPANLAAARRVTVIPGLVDWDWPELGAIETGTAAVLLTYGGSSDNVPGSPVTVNLSDAGRAAADWLVEHGRVVVECEHDRGHTLHPEVGGELVLRFFAAHVGAAPSPWLSSAPALPGSCELRRP